MYRKQQQRVSTSGPDLLPLDEGEYDGGPTRPPPAPTHMTLSTDKRSSPPSHWWRRKAVMRRGLG